MAVSAASMGDSNARPGLGRHTFVLSLLLASCTGDGGDDSGEPDAGVRPEPSEFAPAPAAPSLAQGKLDEIAADIALILDGDETHTIKIVDLSSGQDIASFDASLALTPASNTKLFTTAASLEILGTDHRLATRVYSPQGIAADGSVDELYVIGDHDFSSSTYFYPGDRTPLDRLAAQLYDQGLRSIVGTLHVHGEYVFAGFSLGTLDLNSELATTAGQLQEALTLAGITSSNLETSASLSQPAGTQLLLEHDPLSLVVAVSPLNTVSHNEFADILLRHLGSEMLGESTFVGGAQAIMDWLGSWNAPTTDVEFHDGSGLSHDNRVSAETITSLLAFMNQQSIGQSWRHSLAIAGIRGTIAGRMTGSDTLGRVLAKTGTLNDTIALSGYLSNRYDGQRYAFSILLNNVSNPSASRARCDAIVNVVAANLHANAARLPPPVLQFARGIGFSELLEARWEPVDGAVGYLVWFSEDGKSWSRDRARLVTGTTIIADGMSAIGPSFVKVTALDVDGFESDDSVVFAAQASDRAALILLVDANERWMAEPAVENTLKQNHDFLVALADTDLGYAVDSVSNRALSSIRLEDYAVVVWAAGEESTANDALSEQEQESLSSYLAQGGALLLSGSEILWSLDQRRAAHDESFMDLLQTTLVADDAETYEVSGDPATSFADIELSSFLSPDRLDVQFPDVLMPSGEAQALMHYVGGTGGTAALGLSNRVIVMGFPIEAMPASGDRHAILKAAYEYLGL